MDTLQDQKKLDTSRPFRRQDATEAGITPKELRGPRFRRIFHGVYVDAATPPTPRQRAAAALLTYPESAYASHTSAARVYGLAVPAMEAEHVTVVEPKNRRRRPGIVCHLVKRGRIRTVDGLRVSDHAQLFVELASLLELVDLVVVGDQMVHRGWLTPEQLTAYCAETTLPAAVHARRAAGYVRERVESPMETRLRMLLVLAGLPEPEINLEIRDVDGRQVRRYDLSYPEIKVIVEYDGRQHAEKVEQWESDLDRREAIDNEGWRILVVVARGIYTCPDQTVERVWRLLKARGLSGLPTRPSDDWRPHFPDRS